LDKEGREEGSLEGMSKHTQEVGMWLVRIVEDKTVDGRSNFYFGPFNTPEEASEWMDAYPDDENILEMDAFFLNSPVREDGSPNH
jgi:hypothetical protein